MNRTDAAGRSVEFSISFVKKSTGEIAKYPKAVLTSFHSAGNTVNIMQCGETAPRKIRRCLVIEFNNAIVYY